MIRYDDCLTRYATLFGFGLFDESKKDYKEYLDRFADFVKKNRIDHVILCGGHTDVAHPNKSEAGTMAEYLRPHLGTATIHIEDQSITAEQNISFAKKFLDFSDGNHVFLVSDSARFFKNYWIALDRWYGLSKEQIIGMWFDMVKDIYANPKKTEKAIELKDLRHRLKYRNMTVVIDKLHRNYLGAMHTSISEIYEIEGLYDKKVYDLFMQMTRRKFKME